MSKTIKWLDEYLEISICVALMSMMTLLIFVQVIMRYVFSSSLSWSEELARYLFIWLIYLGISYGCKIRKHIKIDAALGLFPMKTRKYVVILGDIIFFAFAIYIMVTGYELVLMQIKLTKVSPALRIPLQYVASAPMIGFGLAAFRQVQTIVFRIKEIKNSKKPRLGGDAPW